MDSKRKRHSDGSGDDSDDSVRVSMVDEEGGLRIDDIYIPPPPRPPGTIDTNGPRLIITQIVNLNFKSYGGERILGPFHKNFNAIVGPNGSGKSNVIDSMLFVFGYRASKIRSKKMSVLLHKSEQYRNVQSCTVFIHFARIIDKENDPDAYETIPGSEFVVSRTALRDNSSYYQLNGTRVQYKEIASLLRNHGVDLDHNRFLILQGEVEQISLMKPKAPSEHETGMLEYLEDIIGTTRYKEPLDKIQEKVEILSNMRAEKLNRVKLAEQEKDSLVEPMKEAVQFLELENEVAKKRNFLYQRQLKRLQSEATEMDGHKTEVAAKKEEIEGNLNILMEEKRTHNEQFKEEHQLYDQKNKRLEQLKATFDAAHNRDMNLQAEMGEMNKRRKKIIEQLADEETKLKNLENVPEKNHTTIVEYEGREQQLTTEYENLESEKTELLSSLRDETLVLQENKEQIQTNLVTLRNAVDKTKSAFNLAESELRIYVSNEQRERQKLEALQTTFEENEQKLPDRSKSLRELKHRMPVVEKQLKVAVASLERVKLEESRTAQEIRVQRVQVEETRSSMQANKSRGRVLDSLTRQKVEGNLPGLFGRLGDLGAIDMKYDVAVSTACGPLDNIVVDTVDTAQWCIEYLKAHNIGRATFIALDKQEHLRTLANSKINTPENVPRLYDLIKIEDERIRSAFYYALRDTLVAGDINQASRIAYGARRFRVVTLKGELIETSGTMSGGGKTVSRGRMGQCVTVQNAGTPRKMQEMEASLTQLEQKVTELQQRQTTLEDEINTLDPQLRAMRTDVEKFTIEVQSLQAQQPALKEQIRRQEKISKQTCANPAEIHKLQANIDAKKMDYEAASAQSEQLQKQVDVINKEINDKTEKKMRGINIKINECSTMLEKCKEELVKLRVAIKTAERQAKKSEEKIVNLQQEKVEIQNKILQMQAERKEIEEDAVSLVDVIDQLKEELSGRKGYFSEEQEKIAKMNGNIKKLKSEHVELEQELGVINKKITDNIHHFEHLETKLRNLKLQKIPTQAQEELRTYTEQELTETDTRHMEVELKREEDQLKATRPNLTAIHEFEKKEASYLQRIAELDQVTTKRGQMRDLCEDLRKRRHTEFQSGFNLISSKLKEMYQLITLGGDAELEMVDSYDPFAEGIQLNVRPPKKSWKNITNLSGGEKTLSSLALVFALHYFKPSPLYFMDEIDAALDFKNVSIVGNYIKARTKNAQFIIISLRSNMFELADHLVGVYKTYNISKSVTMNPRQYAKKSVIEPLLTQPMTQLEVDENSNTFCATGPTGDNLEPSEDIAGPSGHVTRTASWLPPAEAWDMSIEGALPYGWERALDDQSKAYYINHVNKTTTYETPVSRCQEEQPEPEPRTVTLERSPALGFGFVAGSEKPVIVRFVTEGGPSVGKLLPGDQILSVNGEDVKVAPREHVIALVRACATTVTLVVCQPSVQTGALKSTFMSASKKARLRSRPSRVRFAESVCVNGAPLFPPSAFSLGEMCVPPMANVLKVFLENGQTKSFKYDAWTTVQDVVTSLQAKLCIQAAEHFSLVVEHIKSLRRNKLTLLDSTDTLARIASRPGAHKLRCLFRVTFVPSSAASLAQKDLTALDYLYIQCCNDVTQERFAPELQYDIALRLAALHIYQHALANNMSASKLTVKAVEREFGLERFVPPSILENMKRKEIRKLVAHFLKLHASMAGPGKQLTALQTKLHYLDLVSQLPSYGAKCFSAGPRGDTMERVLLVSPKFGISQITGTRNSVPVPIANIEDMRHVEVRCEDELSRLVVIRLCNERTISVCLEERDASELVLVLRGYYRLATNQSLPVDQDQVPTFEDLAPPYLSLHKVLPEKWSYLNQEKVQQVSFAVPPNYHSGIQPNGMCTLNANPNKAQLVGTLSLDRNMNSSLPNRNHRVQNVNYEKCNSYDIQSVVSMEILENDVVEARNEEVLRRVQEMQQLVENSEKYLTEQQNGRGGLSEWQESSIDVESDNDSVLSSIDDAPGKLKHSDSLLLLTQGTKLAPESSSAYSHTVIDMLQSENNQSESDNDSNYTPHNSPNHRFANNGANKNTRVSFGLRSPDNTNQNENDLKHYLKQLKDQDNTIPDVFDFDPDIIDLTLLPPPATPDELDGGTVLPTPINIPPVSFADCSGLIDSSILNSDLDLEEFLASVTVPPPTQQVTPAVELTPEEIMSYIIPPPPDVRLSMENLSIFPRQKQAESPDVVAETSPETKPNSGVKRRNSSCSVKSNIIEYATVDRKGPFSCCSKGKADKNNDDTSEPIQLPPRKSSDEKPPERPPKFTTESRQRSQSLSSGPTNEPPPQLPPRGDNNHHAPPHIYLPPKKPPLPPVPPLEVLRSRKCVQTVQKNTQEIRTAGIGSPHLQRNKNMYNDIESGFGMSEEPVRPVSNHSTAVSTPTSPHLGRGAPLTAVNIQTPEIENKSHFRTLSQPTEYTETHARIAKVAPEFNHHHIRTQSETAYREKCATLRPTRYRDPEMRFQRNGDTRSLPRNGCSTRENLLAKTDVAMANLLVRLDQVAAQCSAAQVRGGGTLMCEEKFQMAKDELTSQSLQLVTSSKMLVIAMSDPSLPDLPENLAICLTILRRLTELSQDLTNYTTAPLQTRNLVLKVYDVTAAFRHLINSDIDRTSQATIEEHLTQQAEGLAGVLATLLRSLRVFSP